MNIKLSNITKKIDGCEVLKNISFEIDKPGFYGILGNSGAGKTTLLNIILGLTSCDSGKISFDFTPSFSAVFQEDRLLHWLTIYGNIKLKGESDTAVSNAIKLAKFPENLLSKYPTELSGGEKRRVAIARALAHDFNVLVLDEPFTGLDFNTKQTIIENIKPLGKTKIIFLITHDLDDAEKLCTKSILI